MTPVNLVDFFRQKVMTIGDKRRERPKQRPDKHPEKGNVTFTRRKKSTISPVPKLELRILHVSCPYVIRNLCSVQFDWLWEKKGSLHMFH